MHHMNDVYDVSHSIWVTRLHRSDIISYLVYRIRFRHVTAIKGYTYIYALTKVHQRPFTSLGLFSCSSGQASGRNGYATSYTER